MARDYKHSGSRRAKKQSGLPGWAWMLAGLALGLLVALLVYVGARPGGIAPLVTAPAPVAPAEPAAPSASKGEPPAVPKPRFDFYSILPSVEVIIPEQEIAPSKPAAAAPAAPTEAPQAARTAEKAVKYILQVGSFQRYEDADRRKAELALLGVQSSIETVTIDAGGTWHRVRIGPTSDAEHLNNVRIRLRENNIDALLLKLKS